MCAGNELFFVALYVFKFFQGPINGKLDICACGWEATSETDGWYGNDSYMVDRLCCKWCHLLPQAIHQRYPNRERQPGIGNH